MSFHRTVSADIKRRHNRRTGITLQEGKRDEYGMEEVHGIFSSPEKSPVRSNGWRAGTGNGNGNDTMMGSDGMSMDEGTAAFFIYLFSHNRQRRFNSFLNVPSEGSAPDPADFLRGANGRAAHLAPPSARSTTVRKPDTFRSPSKNQRLGSSPKVHNMFNPSSALDDDDDDDDVGDDAGEMETEVMEATPPLTNRSVNAPSPFQTNGLRDKGKMPVKAAQADVTANFSDDDSNGGWNGDENGGQGFESARSELPYNDPTGNESAADSPAHIDADDDSNDDASDAQSPSVVARNTAATKKQTARENAARRAESSDKKARGKRPAHPSRSRSRPDDEEPAARPWKRPKTASHEAANAKGPLDPELNNIVENYANRNGPLKGRSLYILKREVPSDGSVTHTRSGRVSVRPLAYWRNERCIYGDGDAEVGQRFPLSTIREIIRTEELEPVKTSTGKRRSQKGGKGKHQRNEGSDDEEAGDMHPWEKEGVLYGLVRKWDAEAQTATDEEEALDLAYAPAGIETKDVKDSTFRFAKLLSSPFIGSGIVELPPGGVKRPKNSKKMHMVFYVCRGRVEVDVSGVPFSAGKGCVFQVPRGQFPLVHTRLCVFGWNAKFLFIYFC